MNPRLLIGIGGGVLAGFAAGWLLKPDPSTPAANAQSTRIVRLEEELKTKTRDLERLAKPGGIKETAAKSAAKDEPEDYSKNPEVVRRQEQMKKQMEEKQRLKIDERVAGLRTRLGLNDTQTAAIRKLLEDNPGGLQSLMARAMSGHEKGDESEMIKVLLRPGEKDAELNADIAAMLTPEQQQAYTAFRHEQRTNEVEVKANKQLARMQSSLTLTQDQKDKAFAVLSRLADEGYEQPVNPIVMVMAQQLKNKAPGNAELEPHAEEIRAAAERASQQQQQRVEAMRDILTPEQFRLYEGQQQQGAMAEFMDSAFDDMPGAMFGLGAGEAETPPAAPQPEAAR